MVNYDKNQWSLWGPIGENLNPEEEADNHIYSKKIELCLLKITNLEFGSEKIQTPHLFGSIMMKQLRKPIETFVIFFGPRKITNLEFGRDDEMHSGHSSSRISKGFIKRF